MQCVSRVGELEARVRSLSRGRVGRARRLIIGYCISLFIRKYNVEREANEARKWDGRSGSWNLYSMFYTCNLSRDCFQIETQMCHDVSILCLLLSYFSLHRRFTRRIFQKRLVFLRVSRFYFSLIFILCFSASARSLFQSAR